MGKGESSLKWREGGVPISTRFNDPYFSLENGLAETTYVFLQGNTLPSRFTPGFHIAELGFGTGLNLLTAWKAWDDAGQTTPLTFTSFEAFPIMADEMARALSVFPELEPYAKRLVSAWEEDMSLATLPGINVRIHIGDARETLKTAQFQADAWFLDGFSPAKNPELWDAGLMDQVYLHTQKGGTAATYTAAGFVRRNLESSGFTVSRIPGYGRKRHMTTCVKAAQ